MGKKWSLTRPGPGATGQSPVRAGLAAYLNRPVQRGAES
jgi:hypothetical protein